MEDYTGNSQKDKEAAKPKAAVEKKIEPVVTQPVVKQKRGLGRKLKDTIIEADLKGVTRFVVSDVLIPAVKNMLADSATKGVDRMLFGEGSKYRRLGQGPRITYNNPINRGISAVQRYAPSPSPHPRTRQQDDFILSSRQEAESVLERMIDIIDQYDVVSVADLNELCGFPVNHVENKWGWTYLGNVQVRQQRDGYLLDLPPAEPINQ